MYNYNSIKICKQISTPPQPYQKIPDIYFLRSCSLRNFITIPSPITIQFVVDVFVLYAILYLLLYCLLCYFVLRPQSWINSTLSTHVWHEVHNVEYNWTVHVRRRCGHMSNHVDLWLELLTLQCLKRPVAERSVFAWTSKNVCGRVFECMDRFLIFGFNVFIWSYVLFKTSPN